MSTPQREFPTVAEPMPIEFVNTIYAVKGTLKDGLGHPDDLERWLRRHGDWFVPPLPATAGIVVDAGRFERFRSLRDVCRRLMSALVEHNAPDPWDVAELNRASSLGHSWPSLRWSPGNPPSIEMVYAADVVLRAQTEIAQEMIDLLAGARGQLVRACRAPGCVLFFYRHHPRREWCSSGCGNRARVARHYQRHLERTADAVE
jgi:predicted RNA-binding Zn ribbon-like protein